MRVLCSYPKGLLCDLGDESFHLASGHTNVPNDLWERWTATDQGRAMLASNNVTPDPDPNEGLAADAVATADRTPAPKAKAEAKAPDASE